MGGASKTTSTQTNSNPAQLQPSYDTATNNLNSLYSSGQLATYYPGSTVASQDPLTAQALSQISNTAADGSALQASGNNVVSNQLNGTYLNASSNPYLQSAMDAANSATMRQFQNTVAPGVASNFSAKGRYGSNAAETGMSDAEQDLANTLSNSNAAMAYGNYNQGVTNQLNTAQNLGAYQAGTYTNANALLGAGQTNQTQTQSQITDAVNRYNATNPSTALENYIDILNGIKGNTGTVTGTTSQSQNSLLGGLSAFTGLLGLGSGALNISKLGNSNIPALNG